MRNTEAMAYSAVLDNINKGEYSMEPFDFEVTPEEYAEERFQRIENFKNDLFIAYGVLENPKREKLFKIALGRGVEFHGTLDEFDELVELIK